MLMGGIKANAQQLNSEDSTAKGKSNSATYFGGYGNIFYQHDGNEENAQINVERLVLFAGHKFNDKFSFFSEIELEDAKVEGGEEGGELALEQAYIRFNLSRNSYLTAGLFIPRIGILNEDHLPNTYHGNERTQIETLIIPSTWRELGVGYYTTMPGVPLEISAAIMNGLNSSEFKHGTLIRGGRAEGRNASANNLAITGSLRYSIKKFTFQASGYFGGTVALTPVEADSLRLESGAFGTPVFLGEGNIQYKKNAFTVKVLATMVSIPDAGNLNSSFATNIAKKAFGYYVETGYDFLYRKDSTKKKALIGFLRYENFDLNSSIPANGINDPTLVQQHFVGGISYLPIPQIAIKADVRVVSTGDQNPALIINPNPNAPPYKNENTFINIGFGYSF